MGEDEETGDSRREINIRRHMAIENWPLFLKLIRCHNIDDILYKTKNIIFKYKK